jgi:hypothetical protein
MQVQTKAIALSSRITGDATTANASLSSFKTTDPSEMLVARKNLMRHITSQLPSSGASLYRLHGHGTTQPNQLTRGNRFSWLESTVAQGDTLPRGIHAAQRRQLSQGNWPFSWYGRPFQYCGWSYLVEIQHPTLAPSILGSCQLELPQGSKLFLQSHI